MKALLGGPSITVTDAVMLHECCLGPGLDSAGGKNHVTSEEQLMYYSTPLHSVWFIRATVKKSLEWL